MLSGVAPTRLPKVECFCQPLGHAYASSRTGPAAVERCMRATQGTECSSQPSSVVAGEDWRMGEHIILPTAVPECTGTRSGRGALYATRFSPKGLATLFAGLTR